MCAEVLRREEISGAPSDRKLGEMQSVPAAGYRARRRLWLMRGLAVSFSTVALVVALVAADLAVTLGAVVIWILTLLGAAFAGWRDHKGIV